MLTNVAKDINHSMAPHSGGLNPVAPKKKELGKEDFIKLFLTQLKSQSPMKPYDTSEMMQQMSQMTSLSASEELQQTIRSLNTNLGKSQVLAASQLVGKTVQLPSDVSPLVENQGLVGSVILPQPVSSVSIVIKDSSGQVVKKIDNGPSSPGVLDFKWDGLDAEGKSLKADYYKISATATGQDGKSFVVPTAGTFKVNSVAYNQREGGVILNVEGMGGVSMNELVKIL